MGLNNGSQSSEIEKQGDLFSTSHIESANNRQNITTQQENVANKVNICLENTFLADQKIKFFDLVIIENEKNIITFEFKANYISNSIYEDITFNIIINTELQYNNVELLYSRNPELSLRVDLMKYLLTSKGFHQLMSGILNNNNVPNEFKDIVYNHKKYGTKNDNELKELNTYRGEKKPIGKIQLSYNHHPELYLLVKNSNITTKNNHFKYLAEIEVDHVIYTIKCDGLKTTNNLGDYTENLTYVDLNNFEIIGENNFGDTEKNQIKYRIISYLENL